MNGKPRIWRKSCFLCWRARCPTSARPRPSSNSTTPTFWPAGCFPSAKDRITSKQLTRSIHTKVLTPPSAGRFHTERVVAKLIASFAHLQTFAGLMESMIGDAQFSLEMEEMQKSAAKDRVPASRLLPHISVKLTKPFIVEAER